MMGVAPLPAHHRHTGPSSPMADKVSRVHQTGDQKVIRSSTPPLTDVLRARGDGNLAACRPGVDLQHGVVNIVGNRFLIVYGLTDAAAPLFAPSHFLFHF